MVNKLNGICTIDSTNVGGVELDIITNEATSAYIGSDKSDESGDYIVDADAYADQVRISAYYENEEVEVIPKFRFGRVSDDSTSTTNKTISFGTETVYSGNYIVAVTFSRGEVQPLSSGYTKAYDATNIGSFDGRFTIFTKIADGGETDFQFEYVTGSGRLDAIVWVYDIPNGVGTPAVENIKEASSPANSLETVLSYGNMQSVGVPVFMYFTEYRTNGVEALFFADRVLNGASTSFLTANWSIGFLTGTDNNGSRVAGMSAYNPYYYEPIDDFSSVVLSCDVSPPTEANGACAIGFTVTCGRANNNKTPIAPQIKRDTPTAFLITPSDYKFYFDSSAVTSGTTANNIGNASGVLTAFNGAVFDGSGLTNSAETQGANLSGEIANSMVITGSMTIMARITIGNATDAGRVISHAGIGETPSTNWVYDLRKEPAQVSSFWEYSNGVNVSASEPFTFTNGQTYIVEITREARAGSSCLLNFYVDGVLLNTWDTSLILPSGGDSGQFCLGAVFDQTDSFIGTISHALVDDRVISGQQRELIRNEWGA